MQKAKSGKQAKGSENQRAVLELLLEDHQRIQAMFEEFEDLHDEDARRDLVLTTCAELTIHAQLEEELFYPAVRDEIEEANLIDEAMVEHGVAKDLITQLEYTEPDDDLYAATFHVLGEYVTHHVEEEETVLFDQVRESKINLSALAEEMRERRTELRIQHGLEPSGEADEYQDEEEEEEEDEREN